LYISKLISFSLEVLPAELRSWVRLDFRWRRKWQVCPGGKCGRCVGLTIMPLSYADCLETLEVWTLGALRAFPCLYRDYFTFTYINYFNVFLPPIQPLQFENLLSYSFELTSETMALMSQCCGRSEGDRMYSNYAGQDKHKRRLDNFSCADRSSKPRVQSSIVRRQ